MAIDEALTQVNKIIAQLLRENRPDRYTVGDEAGTEWLDDVATEIAGLISDEHVRQVYARKLVAQAEGRATRATNLFIRQIAETGQPPLDWFEFADDPIAVFVRDYDDQGRELTEEQRVALRAATSRDFRFFAAEERRRAANDFATRNATCEAAEWVAEQIASTGAATFNAWAAATAEDFS